MDESVAIVGVPMDLGADRRGVDMGPSAIRYAGLAAQLEGIGRACTDRGDVSVPSPEQRDPDATEPTVGRAKFLGETATVCRRVADAVRDAREAGEFPLVLGGDHSIAIGTVAGSAHDRDLGVVWFDAHGDFNTPETTPSGNVHGMSLAAVVGDGPFPDDEWAGSASVDPENVALVGVRDLDDGERERLRNSAVTTYTMTDIDERGATTVVDEALDVATTGTDGVHVSLDLDWLDPTEAPGVGTPVRGGVSYREAHAAMEYVSDRGNAIASMELVEVNPILDDRNRTAELACELVASAFGKRVL